MLTPRAHFDTRISFAQHLESMNFFCNGLDQMRPITRTEKWENFEFNTFRSRKIWRSEEEKDAPVGRNLRCARAHDQLKLNVNSLTKTPANNSSDPEFRDSR